MIKLALDVATEKANQAKNADDYFSSVESYTDAANLSLEGIMTFCAQVENLIKGLALPTKAEIEERILFHMKSVNEKTHPASFPV